MATAIEHVLWLLAIAQFSFVLGVAVFVIIVWQHDKARLYHVRPMIGSYILLTALAGYRLMFEVADIGWPRLFICIAAFGLGDYALFRLIVRIQKHE